MTFVCVDWGFFKLVWGPYEEEKKKYKADDKTGKSAYTDKEEETKGSRTYVEVKNKSR